MKTIPGISSMCAEKQICSGSEKNSRVRTSPGLRESGIPCFVLSAHLHFPATKSCRLGCWTSSTLQDFGLGVGVSELVVIRSGVDTSTGGYQYTIIFLEETEAVPQMLVGRRVCLRLDVLATQEHGSLGWVIMS